MSQCAFLTHFAKNSTLADYAALKQGLTWAMFWAGPARYSKEIRPKNKLSLSSNPDFTQKSDACTGQLEVIG